MKNALIIWQIFISMLIHGQTPIAYYKFDNSPADFSGHHNDGLIYGNVQVTVDRFGNPCSAYKFDGASAYIEVPSSPSLESISTAFSVTVWYKFDNYKDNTWLTVLCKGRTNNELPNNPQYRLQVQQNNAIVLNSCTVGTPGGSSTVSISTDFTKCDQYFQSHPFEVGKWAFYAMTFDGSRVIVYMNKVKIFDYIYTIPFVSNTSPLYIGMDEPGNTEYFDGYLDDLRIFNKALDEKEIVDLYQEKRAVGSKSDEFDMPFLENKKLVLPSNSCQVKAVFDTPVVGKSTCGTVNVKQILGPQQGDNLKVGKYLVTYEASSTSGYVQYSSFYLTVKDIFPPKIFTPKDTVLYIPGDQKGLLYKYREPIATDNCSVKSLDLIQGLSSGSFFPLGSNLIRYRAIDINGNFTDAQFVVTMKEDTTRKILETPRLPKDTLVKTPSKEVKTDTITRIKKDTIEQPRINIPHVDSNSIAKDTKPKISDAPDLLKRKKTELSFLEVTSSSLKATLYDNGVYDGDTVSLYLNGALIVSKKEVTTKGYSFKIDIDTTIDNELVMYAENLGRIPPNTALLIVYDDDQRHEINLLSTLETNGLIRIRKKKN